MTHLLHITDHAITRHAEHHPGAFERDVRIAVVDGVLLPAHMARPLMGRGPASEFATGHYVLSADRRGIFVLVNDGGIVLRAITYVRLGDQAHALCLREWPPEDEPSGWVRRASPALVEPLPGVPRTLAGAVVAHALGTATDEDDTLLRGSLQEARALLGQALTRLSALATRLKEAGRGEVLAQQAARHHEKAERARRHAELVAAAQARKAARA